MLVLSEKKQNRKKTKQKIFHIIKENLTIEMKFEVELISPDTR